MISINNVSKFFETDEGRISIFDNLSLTIPKGQFTSIIGKSGSGKTTFLNMLAGLEGYQQGEILYDNKNIGHLNDDQKTLRRGKNISFIFQSFHLLPYLTVEENIDLVLKLNKTKARFTIDEILDKVGLSDKKRNYPFTMSGGEQQRAAIARGFIADTPFLFADEPTGNLDQSNAQRVVNLIKDLHQEVKNTIILITHDMEIAKQASLCFELINKNFIKHK